MPDRRPVEHHETATGVAVTVYDDGSVRLMPTCGMRLAMDMRIELTDRDVFEVMSFLAGVKLPGTAEH